MFEDLSGGCCEGTRSLTAQRAEGSVTGGRCRRGREGGGARGGRAPGREGGALGRTLGVLAGQVPPMPSASTSARCRARRAVRRSWRPKSPTGPQQPSSRTSASSDRTGAPKGAHTRTAWAPGSTLRGTTTPIGTCRRSEPSVAQGPCCPRRIGSRHPPPHAAPPPDRRQPPWRPRMRRHESSGKPPSLVPGHAGHPAVRAAPRRSDRRVPAFPGARRLFRIHDGLWALGNADRTAPATGGPVPPR
ncbi:hypothetical protein MBT84_08380 [Streptomyces sp. MBT84]|nr:hypothetical protein [Streptomyces sp. MBT84]